MTTNETNGPDTKPGERRRRGHIVVAMFAVLVIVALGPLATMSWKLVEINRETLTTQMQQTQLLLATSTAHELEARIEGTRSELAGVANLLGVVVRLAAADEQTQRVLTDVAGQTTPYLRFDYLQGQRVQTIAAGSLPAQLTPYFDSAFERTLEMRAGAASGELPRTLLGDPMLLDEGGSSLIVVAPVMSRGRFRGVLSAMLDLDELWLRVTRDAESTGQVIYAVDERGGVFASSDGSRMEQGRQLAESPLVRRFLGSRRQVRQTMPFESADSDGETSYIGSFEWTRYGWGIFVQAPTEQIYWSVRKMIESTLTWAALALALAALAALYFARRVSRPIKQLAAASRLFARGTFGTRVEVTAQNEIGELADTFNAMAREIENYIHRLRRALADNNELLLGTIRALAQAIDAKDPYTRGHSVRVNRYSVIIARALGLEDAQIREIHVASLMHDVGKIGIDDSILKKPGALTDDEFDVMKTHTVLGATIMTPIKQMKRMLPGLRSHHERMNGTGYPDGLGGADIPLMARIIAVADTFDAITTTRPYQQPMTWERAVERLNELKGDALDPQVVEAFNRAYQAGLIVPTDSEDDAGPIPAQSSDPGATEPDGEPASV